MKGLDLLNRLPENVKEKIITKYGSLHKYYNFVYNLYESDYHWFLAKTEEARTMRQKIQNQIFDLEDKLVDFGLDFENPVISEISADHSEKVLENYLKKLK